MNEEGGEVAENIAAGRSAIVVAEFGIVVANVGGNFKLQLRNLLSIGIIERLIYLACHMENDILIRCIDVMMMAKPIAGLLMDFHITHPLCTIQLDFSPYKIGACVRVVNARIEHFQTSPIGCSQFMEWKNLMFPRVVKQLFHVFCIKICSKVVKNS